jgi:hypothetical protein
LNRQQAERVNLMQQPEPFVALCGLKSMLFVDNLIKSNGRSLLGHTSLTAAMTVTSFFF